MTRCAEHAGVLVAGFAVALGAGLWSAAAGHGCGDDGCSSDAECDDGVFCNGAERCTRIGCRPGLAACDDGLACTLDECSEETRICTNTADDTDGDTFTDADCGGPDCDDRNAAVRPGAAEECNGIDDDCDGIVPEDRDGDGRLDPAVCPSIGDDCDDDDPRRYPGAAEICDGVDNNCSGDIDDERDTDGDTAVDQTCGGDDCDDEDPLVRPGADEQCNGRDDDCDGLTDETFPCRHRETGVTCWTSCGTAGTGRCTGECRRPTGADCNPPDERCGNGIDDDCDTDVDEGCPGADAGCVSRGDERCDNGIDDDCDGSTDEAACRPCPACAPRSFRYCNAGTAWGWGLQMCSDSGLSWGRCVEDAPPPGCSMPGWDQACCTASGGCCASASGASVGLGCAPAPPCD